VKFLRRRVHTIVVAYHAANDLDRCLTALETADATVVDNSGSRAVAEVARRHGVRYVDPGSNLGFAAGVNVALRDLLRGDPVDVLLLNPDAEMSPGARDQMVECLHDPEQPRCSAVAPRLVGSDGIPQRTLWPFPSPLRAWADAVGLGGVSSRSQFAIGAVLLLRWEAIRERGLFDERFFLYAEETDWQRRALVLGWRTRLCDEATALHVGAGTSADLIYREKLFHVAHEKYILKWHRRAGWLVYRAAAVTGAGARALVLRADRRREAARRLMIYARGPSLALSR